jgi:hypothetical protein
MLFNSPFPIKNATLEKKDEKDYICAPFASRRFKMSDRFLYIALSAGLQPS